MLVPLLPENRILLTYFFDIRFLYLYTLQILLSLKYLSSSFSVLILPQRRVLAPTKLVIGLEILLFFFFQYGTYRSP
jgi:hypothetical protein